MSKWLRRFREYQESSGVEPATSDTQGSTLQESPDNTDTMAAEIAWRVAAFRSQVPATGPIPFLVARETPLLTLEALALGIGTGEPVPVCLSCGDALDEGCTVRCVPCVLAIETVLNEVREGVEPTGPGPGSAGVTQAT